MGEKPDAFLTEKRRAVLEGRFEGSDGVERTHKSRIRARSRSALSELLEVAASPEVDNADVFDPELIHALLRALMMGSGGLRGDDVPEHLRAWDPDPEYANTVYVAVNRALKGAPREESP